jgi:hypothetical protein
MFTGLVPIDEAKQLLCQVNSVDQSVDLGKKIKACREYDSKTKERRNYWAELSLWNDRTTGKLIQEAKEEGVIGHAHKPDHKNSSSASVAELLGIDSEVRASHLSRISQKLAKPPEEEFAKAIEVIKESGEEVSRAAILKKLTGAHVGHNAGENEWYTPKQYIDAAVKSMGSIDLDPASSLAANQIVGAAKFFTADDDGLKQEWNGNVWMNPPYAQPLIGHFAKKLSDESGVTQFCALVNNATETKWFQAIASKASAICFPSGRVKFWHPDRESAPLQGQAVLYGGPNWKRFISCHKEFGFCVKLQ